MGCGHENLPGGTHIHGKIAQIVVGKAVLAGDFHKSFVRPLFQIAYPKGNLLRQVSFELDHFDGLLLRIATGVEEVEFHGARPGSPTWLTSATTSKLLRLESTWLGKPQLAKRHVERFFHSHVDQVQAHAGRFAPGAAGACSAASGGQAAWARSVKT